LSYGNSSTIYIVAKHGSDLKYPPEAVFTSESAAKAWAKDNATRSADYAIYECTSIGTMVLDEPRWSDNRPQAENKD
jgi:hypothetical protein